eukprot:TRINITY_DN3397_c0_g3_i7.p1 TRINITY_DN3397_c0_g3~~TRINITY_DN3397_c0_g3_i7.p1  ORF type:complete len:218 (-),score=52.06 TRINITY_DN3397_c0_g3_i7:51-704(-)
MGYVWGIQMAKLLAKHFSIKVKTEDGMSYEDWIRKKQHLQLANMENNKMSYSKKVQTVIKAVKKAIDQPTKAKVTFNDIVNELKVANNRPNKVEERLASIVKGHMNKVADHIKTLENMSFSMKSKIRELVEKLKKVKGEYQNEKEENKKLKEKVGKLEKENKSLKAAKEDTEINSKNATDAHGRTCEKPKLKVKATEQIEKNKSLSLIHISEPTRPY